MKKPLQFIVLMCIIFSLVACSQETKATDAFGLCINPDAEGDYYNYFSLPSTWKNFDGNENYKLSEKFEFETVENYEDSNGNNFNANIYTCGLGSIPIIDACGTSKIIAQEFALQNLNEDSVDLCYQKYPVFHSDDMTTYYYESLFEKKTITKELYVKDKNIYKVYEQKATDVVINNSGLNDIPKLKNIKTKTIGYDALVFFTNKENPINSLTQEQIRNIYSGDIVNWNEISDYNMKVDAYSRGECTQNRVYFDNVVMKNLAIKKSNYTKTPQPFAFEDFKSNKYPAEFSNEPGSISYGYKSMVENYYGDNVKILDIDSIEPSQENIQNNIYPYTIEITATTRTGTSGNLGEQVVEWFLSDVGKKYLAQRNIIPVK